MRGDEGHSARTVNRPLRRPPTRSLPAVPAQFAHDAHLFAASASALASPIQPPGQISRVAVSAARTATRDRAAAIRASGRAPGEADRPSFEMLRVLANPDAIAANRRYVDVDLNRCFTHEILGGRGARRAAAREARRAARAEASASPRVDLCLDVHTTTSAMGPADDGPRRRPRARVRGAPAAPPLPDAGAHRLLGGGTRRGVDAADGGVGDDGRGGAAAQRRRHRADLPADPRAVAPRTGLGRGAQPRRRRRHAETQLAVLRGYQRVAVVPYRATTPAARCPRARRSPRPRLLRRAAGYACLFRSSTAPTSASPT